MRITLGHFLSKWHVVLQGRRQAGASRGICPGKKCCCPGFAPAPASAEYYYFSNSIVPCHVSNFLCPGLAPVGEHFWGSHWRGQSVVFGKSKNIYFYHIRGQYTRLFQYFQLLF